MPKIIGLETEKGNQILDALRTQGWKRVKQYNPLAFDKGIDFDSYTFRRGDEKLYFEWTNWLEWEISGAESALVELAKTYNLNIDNDD